ncbi:MAG TPA: M1 family metallopeptidase [Flavisolibacter sp.]|nr:M1 family metallopeptidase [Flavisolibacter sp.]
MKFRLVLLVILSATIAQAQDLYMPRDIRKAFDKGTRSLDGKPGKNYWQNRGRYTINITAAPPSRTIQGLESISYINNSPDTLKNLVFKMILNIHKPGAPRLSGVSEDYLTSGIHIDSFVVNGQTSKGGDNPNYFTSVPVRLPKALLPKDSVQLVIKWHYDVSLLSNREGMIDSTTYFLAYFYPRVAVYDDYQGWDFTTFNDALEFYNDFNDYTVNVQVPKNYIVWGTGTLLNPAAVLAPEINSRYQQSLTSDAIVNIVTAADLAGKKVTAQNAMNTWQFRASNVPDAAFGISDHFVWDGTSALVDPITKRRASAQAAYNDTASDYHYVAGFAKRGLEWLSANWPGIPYPYEKTTVFQGYAGMEYPMMANDETYGDTTFSRFVAEHEIAHTYMPFYMGINETRYGFMDEGWATTFELLRNRETLGREQADEFYRQFRVNQWISDVAQDEDLPIITPGPNLNGGGLGNNQYGKPSLGYLAVKEILGDALFKKALHEYMSRWNGKHPLPWDFFNSINAGSGKNLNWFWNNWFFSNYYIDLGIQSVTKTSTGYSLQVKNTGGMAAPFDVVIHYKDGSKDSVHQSPAVWMANQKTATIALPTKKTIQSVELNGGIYVDANTKDNVWGDKAF